MTDKHWLENSAYLDWLTFERPVDVETYARQRLDTVCDLGAGTHCYLIQVGGRTIHDSRYAERADGLNADLLAALIAEAHRRDVKFVAGYLATLPACAVEATEHPDWISKRPDGMVMPDAYLCYNSPYRDLLFARVREVLAGYEVDGIYFDQLPLGCCCDYCRRQYEEIYGEPFPDLTNEQVHSSSFGAAIYLRPGEADARGLCRSLCERLLDFVNRSRRSWIWNIRRAIAETRPDCALILNRVEHVDAAHARDEVDAFLPEAYLPWSDRANIPLERQVTSLYTGKPVWHVVKVDKRAVSCIPIDEVKTALAEVVSLGHVPILRDQDALDYMRPSDRESVCRAMRDMTGVRQSMRDLPDNGYAAVLHSSSAYAVSHTITNSSFYGMASFLSERHLPFRMVTEEHLQEGRVRERVLIVPNCVCLEDGTVAAIEAYCRAGGSLLVTARSGEMDENRAPRAEDPLGDLLGIRRIGWQSNRKPFPVLYSADLPKPTQHPSDYSFVRMRKEPHPVIAGYEEALTDFNLGHVETESAGGDVLAKICAFDQAGIMARHYNRRIPFPGGPRHPFLIVREAGARSVYFAAPVCSAEGRNRCEILQAMMSHALGWLAGPPDIRAVDLPPAIRMSVKGSLAAGKMLILLNSRYVLGGKAFGYNNAVLKLNCETTRIRSCRGLFGAAVETLDQGETTDLRIEKIRPYEAIEIELL